MNNINLKKVEEHYKKVTYHTQHPELNLQEWQYSLRVKFAEKSTFGIKKSSGHKVFSDYIVNNPVSKNTYKVSIRDNDNSMNFCNCFDFKTNNLGTCKHIEAVLLKINSNEKLSKILKTSYKPNYSSFYIDYRNDKAIRLRIGSENIKEYENLSNSYFDSNNFLPKENYHKFYEIYKEAHKINNSFKCYSDVISSVVNYIEDVNRKKIIDTKFSTNNGEFNHLVKAELFPYQKEGVKFASKAGRSLLADDMGLGKTIQAIATAELMKAEFGIEKVLIVCPTSLKYQWKAEISKFTDSKITVIEGLPHKRPEQYTSKSLYCIVSYHTAANDIEEIERLKPDLVILDEAQRIKNFKTRISQIIKKIPSDYALVLTGTPLENKLEELYSIVQFIDPFVLGPYHEFMANHQVKNENGKIVGYKDLNQIGKKLSSLMLRRTKKQVLTQLPERMDKVLFVPMTEKQMEWHEEYGSVVANLVRKWQRMGFLNEKDRNRLMINMNMMRMVCDSTFIIDQETRNDTKVDELMNIIEEVDAEGAEKIVVFSQWHRMTRIIANELVKKGIKFEHLNGTVPSKKRESLFDNFNNNPEVKVFLSTDAGGTGLNLQAASYLVNVDIPWNPAVLEQRIARIHRLGQKKNVSIINLVSTGTIEHRMLDVIKFKSSLAEGILDNGDDTIFMDESKFKKFMSTVGDIVEPEKINGLHVVQDAEEKEAEVNKIEVLANHKEVEEIIADTVFEDQQSISAETTKPEDNLITQGLSLLGKLAQTLADKEATQQMIASITEKDEKTGKTYLKVPVESEKIIENAACLLGSFLKNLK